MSALALAPAPTGGASAPLSHAARKAWNRALAADARSRGACPCGTGHSVYDLVVVQNWTFAQEMRGDMTPAAFVDHLMRAGWCVKHARAGVPDHDPADLTLVCVVCDVRH